MYLIYFLVVYGGDILILLFVASVANFLLGKCFLRKAKSEAKQRLQGKMLKPQDDLPFVMRQIIDSAYRPGTVAMTKRAELIQAVRRIERDQPEVYDMHRHLILPVLLHPRHEHVRFSSKPGQEGFRVNPDPKLHGVAKRMRGLLNMQRQVFYPDFKYEELTKQARLSSKTKTGKGKKRRIDVPEEDRRSTIGCAWTHIDRAARNGRGVGKELGKQVHDQLQSFSRDQQSFSYGDSDPYTKAIVDKILRRWNMVPLWGELEIWDETLQYATCVDMVCLDPSNGGRIVFFEVKTGYTEAFTHQHHKVQGNVKIWNNPCGHAMIQLIIPIETMRRKYGVQNIHGYVLHVNEEGGVKVYKLPVDGKDISYQNVYNRAINVHKRKKAAASTKGRGKKKPKRAKKKM